MPDRIYLYAFCVSVLRFSMKPYTLRKKSNMLVLSEQHSLQYVGTLESWSWSLNVIIMNVLLCIVSASARISLSVLRVETCAWRLALAATAKYCPCQWGGHLATNPLGGQANFCDESPQIANPQILGLIPQSQIRKFFFCLPVNKQLQIRKIFTKYCATLSQP